VAWAWRRATVRRMGARLVQRRPGGSWRAVRGAAFHTRWRVLAQGRAWHPRWTPGATKGGVAGCLDGLGGRWVELRQVTTPRTSRPDAQLSGLRWCRPRPRPHGPRPTAMRRSAAGSGGVDYQGNAEQKQPGPARQAGLSCRGRGSAGGAVAACSTGSPQVTSSPRADAVARQWPMEVPRETPVDLATGATVARSRERPWCYGVLRPGPEAPPSGTTTPTLCVRPGPSSGVGWSERLVGRSTWNIRPQR
jgi:hypothetical protein